MTKEKRKRIAEALLRNISEDTVEEIRKIERFREGGLFTYQEVDGRYLDWVLTVLAEELF